ncbi:MAG: hypothetical protein OXU71_11045 [Gammaproteobacteria bacterium]|nr:hypothetical protein [Gammaproteobacteria bacterium]
MSILHGLIIIGIHLDGDNQEFFHFGAPVRRCRRQKRALPGHDAGTQAVFIAPHQRGHHLGAPIAEDNSDPRRAVENKKPPGGAGRLSKGDAMDYSCSAKSAMALVKCKTGLSTDCKNSSSPPIVAIWLT